METQIELKRLKKVFIIHYLILPFQRGAGLSMSHVFVFIEFIEHNLSKQTKYCLTNQVWLNKPLRLRKKKKINIFNTCQ